MNNCNIQKAQPLFFTAPNPPNSEKFEFQKAVTVSSEKRSKSEGNTPTPYNPNSKASKDSMMFDRYIEQHVFKSDETKRKRVSYT